MSLEIEHKYLLSSVPDQWPVTYTEDIITQTYLKAPSGITERVRSRGSVSGSGVVYTHTIKVPLVDDAGEILPGQNQETEKEIEKPLYDALLRRADLTMTSILKCRRVFVWDNQIFELDIFRHPSPGLALLEIEVEDMQAEVRLPPFLPIVREVTLERAYTNAALARSK